MPGRGGVVLPKLIDNGALTKELDARLKKMVTGVEATLRQGAKTATEVSRQVFSSKEVGRPWVSPRAHRSTTGGRFTDLIEWIPHRVTGGDLMVDLDLAKLESGTPTFYGGPGYWLIQEIGTGKEAAAHVGVGDVYQHRYKIKSQVGRPIPFGLTWGTFGATSNASTGRLNKSFGTGTSLASSRTSGDQIMPTELVPGSNPKSQVVIGREIEGKHYLRDGGVAGFTQFQASALVAAKQAFAGRRRRT